MKPGDAFVLDTECDSRTRDERVAHCAREVREDGSVVAWHGGVYKLREVSVARRAAKPCARCMKRVLAHDDERG